MPNYFWYTVISLLSTLLFTYTFLKVRDKHLVGVYFFIAGGTYAFEYIILVLFDSYVYHPGFLKDPYFDSIAGAVVSDAFSVPMCATFAAAFRLKFKVRFLIMMILVGIEVLFSHLKIYQHHWWRYEYTAMGILFALWASQKWFHMLEHSMKPIIRFVTLFLTEIFLQASLIFIVRGIFYQFFFQIGWFQNPTRDHVAFSTAYLALVGLLIVF
mgnify:CR=1 FL=1